MSTQAFRVAGNAKLKGEITPQGAKNEALQIICASLLTPEEVVIENIPDIVDVRKLISLIEGLGVKVERVNKNKYTFKADDRDIDYMSTPSYQENAQKIRGSVMLLGPILARFKKAFLPKPGGDKIGRRRLDTHFIGFQKLGANFKYNEKESKFYLDAQHLKGTFILMEVSF